MEKPEVFIFFCDDVRHELGGRLSLMGLHGTQAIIEGDSGYVKSFTVGAIIRYISDEPVEATIEITAKSNKSVSDLPALPPLLTIPMDPGERGIIQNGNILAEFGSIKVHAGLSIVATVTVLGDTFTREISFVSSNVPVVD
ncbi:hypothetical protein FHW96_000265 [Novosphingobium sp. SG751A]|uniref:hypothetical protein n=1 Tax=Novosphingobium sp. SG751A TaxID=2587000 RepID=UPI001557503A|nr:hypothetical protein [Novosphingobium sp. SG751A]NOW44138.1 hypothetical protein [Novosphingobium sp. SG751A]